MAHFAEIDSSNTVINVIVVDNKHEANGEIFCQQVLNSNNRFIQTSYNTKANTHPEGRPLRKNYACKGYKYDAEMDAFIPPRPYESWKSWTLNTETCIWEPPVPMPPPLPYGTVNKSRAWSEANTAWIIIDYPDPNTIPKNYTAVFDEENCRWSIVRR